MDTLPAKQIVFKISLLAAADTRLVLTDSSEYPCTPSSTFIYFKYSKLSDSPLSLPAAPLSLVNDAKSGSKSRFVRQLRCLRISGCGSRANKTFAACNLATWPLLAAKKLNGNTHTQTHTLAHTQSADTTKLTTMRARQHEKN